MPLEMRELLDEEQVFSGNDDGNEIEVSIVMPCLNEAETLATCIGKAFRWLREHGIEGEIIVADNGSTDGSQEIAFSMAARLLSAARLFCQASF